MRKAIREHLWLLTIPMLMAAFGTMVALVISTSAAVAGDTGPPSGAACGGLIYEDSVTVTRTIGGDVAFTAIKDVRVCFDSGCGDDDDGASDDQQSSSSASGRSSGVTGSGGHATPSL